MAQTATRIPKAERAVFTAGSRSSSKSRVMKVFISILFADSTNKPCARFACFCLYKEEINEFRYVHFNDQFIHDLLFSLFSSINDDTKEKPTKQLYPWKPLLSRIARFTSY